MYNLMNFKYTCPHCLSWLFVKYRIIKGSVLIDYIDSEYNLIDFCANCKHHFDDNEMEKVAQMIEKRIEEDKYNLFL